MVFHRTEKKSLSEKIVRAPGGKPCAHAASRLHHALGRHQHRLVLEHTDDPSCRRFPCISADTSPGPIPVRLTPKLPSPKTSPGARLSR